MICDSRLQKSVRSVQALEKLLVNVALDPGPYSEEKTLKDALRSQGALAKYHSEKLEIQASSINTLKRAANLILIGKYPAFDEKRIKALQALQDAAQTATRAKKTRQKTLEARLLKLKFELQTALQDNWLLTQAFDKSLKQSRYYATQAIDPLVLALCDREQAELRAIFKLRVNVKIEMQGFE